MSQFDDLRERFNALAPRERRMVVVGGVALLLIVLWLAIIAPWLNAKASLRARVDADTRLLAWMQQTTVRIKQLERSHPRAAPRTGQSLFATVEQTAQASPVGANIKQFQPRGTKTVQVRLEGASFDALVSWLGQLQTQHGVIVSGLGIQRADAPGTVNADVTLERPAA